MVDELLSGLPRLALSWLMPMPRDIEVLVGVRDDEGDMDASNEPL